MHVEEPAKWIKNRETQREQIVGETLIKKKSVGNGLLIKSIRIDCMPAVFSIYISPVQTRLFFFNALQFLLFLLTCFSSVVLFIFENYQTFLQPLEKFSGYESVMYIYI